jgi:hypothetical protein
VVTAGWQSLISDVSLQQICHCEKRSDEATSVDLAFDRSCSA